MDITITVNPSVDRLYQLKELKVGSLNRVNLIKKMVGGKGINAARVASNLGAKTAATGFLAGYNGQYIEDQACEDQYTADFIKIAGNTRNCYTIIQQNNKKTEINEHGDYLSSLNFTYLLNKLKSLISNNKISAISLNGSLPPTQINNFYTRIISLIRTLDPKIKIILDTSGKALTEVLKSNLLPDFIKPNEQEIADLLSTTVTYDCYVLKEEITQSNLNKIQNIIVSLGAKGALIKHHEHFFQIKFNPVKVVNTEGSGDSVVGGLLYALDKQLDFESAIRWAIAAGTANAMETKTGFVQKNNVKQIMKTIELVPIK
ncbi:1-phosphofructokinase family hexose kinase [Lactobacillus sp. ESL0679]|uniref:1-phosphofructokinase family hexose kinase n=1 Tax=Lactobacillus sp. ESL0679 TaxID=2983209 RepID=UPI0023F89CAB|nr:1-phosphofructokinase family hexose kinase [Lactobacillus sp. ESL0679]MDF7682994.1 1-phosphofructokinase family hexose kinase [Lactobacillus sp. ESL0679]